LGVRLQESGIGIQEPGGKAESGDGVTRALALVPDLIVLDFDLDGENTALLRAHISTRGIPMIALARMDEVRARG